MTADPATAALLQKIAARENSSVSAVAHDLILQALAYEEDRYLSAIAEKNEKSHKRKIGHEAFWDKIV